MKFEIEYFLSYKEFDADIVDYIRTCIYYNSVPKKFVSLFKIKEYNIANNQIHFDIINDNNNQFLNVFEIIIDGKKYLGCEINSVKYLNKLYYINQSSKYVNMNKFNWKRINDIIIENIIE